MIMEYLPCMLHLVEGERKGVRFGQRNTLPGSGISGEFNEGLRYLGMTEGSGLVLCDANPADGHTYLALEKARKYGADGVYLRKFDNNRPPIPQIYLYDWNGVDISPEEITALHKKLWNAAAVPIFFVFSEGEIEIYNCSKSPICDGQNSKHRSVPMETLYFHSRCDTEQAKQSYFQARQWDNGCFWESSPYRNEFKLNDGIGKTLLRHLKQLSRTQVTRNRRPEEDVLLKKVTAKIILLEYLSHQRDRDGSEILPRAFFNGLKEGARGIADFLRKKGEYVRVLKALDKYFGVNVFSPQSEMVPEDLGAVARFLETQCGEDEWGNSRTLFAPSHIPEEIFCSIYEEFLLDKHDCAATPPQLVSLLIDEAMPLEAGGTDFKVLDPACGKGIFAVAAYWRLILRWRLLNHWKRPDMNVLIYLLHHNIHALDLDGESRNFTAFMLTLVLLKNLTTREIRLFYRVPRSHPENVRVMDFFQLVKERESAGYRDDQKRDVNQNAASHPEMMKYEYLQRGSKGPATRDGKSLPLALGEFSLPRVAGPPEVENLPYQMGESNEGFDLVIGKPPFIKAFTTPFARKTEEKQRAQRPPVPGKHLALLFLEQAVQLCRPGGLACMPVPSGPFLYNNNSFDFRRSFLEKFRVVQVLDFSALSETFFGNTHAAAAVFAQNEKPLPNDDQLAHITFRRTHSSKERFLFEADVYDFFTIPYKTALEDKLIWKSNFLGGGRLHHLVSKLSLSRHFGKYYLFYAAAFSGHYMINKAGRPAGPVKKGLPDPGQNDEWRLSEIERMLVDDVSTHMLEFRRKGERSEAVKPLADENLEQFADVYCKILNSVYKKFIPCPPLKTATYVCLPIR
ncbi:MAG: hypothetical protein GY765_40030, partial [bacterium]|nr:hypothetical protein [bacterium]